MKKLLMMTDSLGGGGAERVLIHILSRLNPEEFDITLFLLFKQGIYLDRLPSSVKLKYLCLGNDDLNNKNMLARLLLKLCRKALLELNRLLKGRLIYQFWLKEKYDTEVSFIEGETLLYVANSRNSHCRKISWIHTDLKQRRTISRKKEKASLLKMDQIICVSQGAEKSVLDLYPELSSKTCVIYNPADIGEILQKSSCQADFKKGINLLCVGRLEKVKGFDLVIRAHKALMDEGIENNITIIGEGSQKAELEKLISRLEVQNTVFLAGYKHNPYAYIKACDILVISSLYEGLSLVLMEGLLLDKPVISTHCTGPSEILGEGYGLLVEAGDVTSLKNAMKLMITDPKLRAYYSEQSKKRKRIFYESQAMDQIINLL